MGYRGYETSLLNDITVLLLSVILVGNFILNLILYHLKHDPGGLLLTIIIIVVFAYLVWIGIKKILEYFGTGLIEVIREIRGTSITTSKKIDVQDIKVYEANENDVETAIQVLTKFGMKKSEASLKVHKTVMSHSLDETDNVQKIVRLSLQ